MPRTQDERLLVDEQYAGRKAPLRPILDRLTEAALVLGDDVTAEVESTYVAFARKRRFAVVRPSSATRVDLGLVLRDPPASDRLLAAESVGGVRVDVRVPLEELDDVDGEVLGWLALAYRQDGE